MDLWGMTPAPAGQALRQEVVLDEHASDDDCRIMHIIMIPDGASRFSGPVSEA